jgi:hypothetical protein
VKFVLDPTGLKSRQSKTKQLELTPFERNIMFHCFVRSSMLRQDKYNLEIGFLHFPAFSKQPNNTLNESFPPTPHTHKKKCSFFLFLSYIFSATKHNTMQNTTLGLERVNTTAQRKLRYFCMIYREISRRLS